MVHWFTFPSFPASTEKCSFSHFSKVIADFEEVLFADPKAPLA